MDDLVTWLRDQLDVDERAALAWMPLGNPTDAERDHIARHDPTHVLAEVDAKRRILAEVEQMQALEDQVDGEWGSGSWSYDATDRPSAQILRALALPYADRPGYRDGWRPAGVAA
jgi:hypothetical protein